MVIWWWGGGGGGGREIECGVSRVACPFLAEWRGEGWMVGFGEVHLRTWTGEDEGGIGGGIA